MPRPEVILRLYSFNMQPWVRRIKGWLNQEGDENLLLVLTVLGVILGIALGLFDCISPLRRCFNRNSSGSILRNFQLSDQTELLIRFPGEILMNILKCLILPLIMFSLISSKSTSGTFTTTMHHLRRHITTRSAHVR